MLELDILESMFLFGANVAVEQNSFGGHDLVVMTRRLHQRLGFGPIFSARSDGNFRDWDLVPKPTSKGDVYRHSGLLSLDTASVLADYQAYRDERGLTSSPNIKPRFEWKKSNTRVEEDRAGIKSPRDIFLSQVDLRFAYATHSVSDYYERLVWFWANHFAVSGVVGGARLLGAGLVEAEAIRPYVAARLADMLVAVSMHWAMLRYLDGNSSIGPNSRAGINRDRGLNENWARETLELHTLGVDGGYSQGDVVALAKILTGWRFRWFKHEDAGAFAFSMDHHQPGPKTLLGKTYPDEGFEQGLAALHDLARHPSTVRHIATKLVRHFVADAPPERLVRELEGVFLETEGDLGAVARTLAEAPEVEELPPTKLRLPQEFLASMLRATATELEPALIEQFCRVMGHPVWQPSGPDGFPDKVAHWLSPEGMKRRLDVAIAVAERVDPTLDPLEVLDVTVGDIAGDDTRLAVARAETRQQAFALLFMSPEFQWR